METRMINKLRVGIFSLCLIGAVAFNAKAQQTTSPAAGGPKDSQNIRQEIASLHVEKMQLGTQLKALYDQVTPLYDQFRKVSSQIKQIQDQIKPIDDQMSDINKKLKIDENKLKQLQKTH